MKWGIYFTLGQKKKQLHCPLVSGVRGIFFRGQSHFSWFFSGMKCLFPVQISILVDPKQISVVFNSEKKEKKSSAHFSPYNFKFPPSLLQFSFFSSQFSFFFPFLSFSGRLAKISQWKISVGCTLPPACYATAFSGISECLGWLFENYFFFIKYIFKEHPKSYKKWSIFLFFF